MTKSGLAAVAFFLAVTAALAAPAQAAPPAAVDHVLIISTPRLTWRQVADVQPPNLLRLFRQGAVASMSVRTISARTTIGEGYATIGAGNRAAAVDLTAGLAFDAGEQYEGAPAREVYTRRTGKPARGQIFELGFADSYRRNRRLLYGARLGSMGWALGTQGQRAAVIANADGDAASSLVPGGAFHREAALALMDRDGRVNAGTVGAGLNAADPTAPFGVRLDAAKVVDAFNGAWASNDVVLLELSDLERADAYGDVATTAARRDAATTALRASDDLVGRVLQHVDLTRTLVIVATPASPRAAEQLGVAAIAGPGIHRGLARSPTTRRAGYVTLPDVAPTVLHALGVAIPKSMNGTAMTSVGGATPSVSTAREFARDSTLTTFRDKATGPVSVLFVVFQVLVYIACVIALARQRPRRAATAIAVCALMVLAMPLIGFLSGLFHYDALGLGGYIAVFFAVAAVLAAIAWGIGRRRRLLAPAVLIGATALMLVIDVLAGGPLQLNTVFGYSPVVAGRFAGYGNLAYGLLAMSAITIATIAWALLDGGRRAAVVVGAVLVVALVVDGAPWWGSDVGGVLASVPAFLVVGAVLAQRRFGWRRIAVAVGATAAAVVVFAAIDLARPTSQRTHLGRLAADPGNSGDVIQRKLESNLHILTSSIWTLIIPVALAFLLFLALRPPGLLQTIQRRVPGLRACLVGGLLAGLLGFAVNDSGVAVPAMMLAVLLPYLSYLLMTTDLTEPT